MMLPFPLVLLWVTAAVAAAPEERTRTAAGSATSALDPAGVALPAATDDWTAEERAVLDQGQAVHRYERDASGRQYGRAAVRVRAPADAVWTAVLDYDHYVRFLPYVTASAETSRTPTSAGERVKATYDITVKGMVTHFALDSELRRSDGVVAFTLSSHDGGAVEAGQGWWRLTPWEDEANVWLLEYGVDLGLRWWVPGFVERKAADRGLPVLVRQMARQAERVSAQAATVDTR
jgi:ribosome-associated toxin RatA of RatAB toxin-antitoxin module